MVDYDPRSASVRPGRRRKYSPKDIRQRPPQAAQRPGLEGREMAQAASVSAAKTPTAEPDREGLWSRRDERPERVALRDSEGALSRALLCVSTGVATRGRQSGSGRGIDETRRRHAGLVSGGPGSKRTRFTRFFDTMASPRQGVSPGSSRGFDARGLRTCSPTCAVPMIGLVNNQVNKHVFVPVHQW